MTRKALRNQKERNENKMGWLFASPLTVGLFLFLLFPLLFAIIISFTDYKMYDGYSFFDFRFNFVGFEQYAAAFKNENFMYSMINALINCIGVPIGIFLAIILTNLLVRNEKASLFFRTLYYLPTVCGAVIITFIWQWLFTLVPQWLGMVGSLNMLDEGHFMLSMIIMGIWSGLGTSILLLYSSMKGVDKALYESAQIDGANGFNQLIHITMPSVSPVMFYVMFTGILGSFQDFARFQVMGADSPSLYKIMPVWEIYRQVTNDGNLSLASAMSIILGLIIMAISLIQFLVSKYWVNND